MTKLIYKFSVSLFLSTILLSNAYAGAGEEAEVRAAFMALMDTYNNGDLEGHLDMFADNSIELPPGRPIVSGIDAISARKKSEMGRADATLEPHIDELIVSGDWAFVRISGSGIIKLKDGTTFIPEDKAIMIWKRNDQGQWKMTHDIWNSSLPRH